MNIINPSLSLSGTNAIVCGQNGASAFIRYSTNNGTTWNIPSSTPTTLNNITSEVSIDRSVAMIGGVNITTNSSVSWTASSQSLANTNTFTAISVSGNNGLASINNASSTGFLFYSTSQGAAWTQIPGLSSTTINDANLSGNLGIAGTSAGIYYSSSPLCYEANTLILVLENEEEVYKKLVN